MTPDTLTIPETVTVPVSALVEAAGAMYALEGLFAFMIHESNADYGTLAAPHVYKLLSAAGLARPTSDGLDFVVDLKDGVEFDAENRARGLMLADIAKRAADESAQLLGTAVTGGEA